MAAKSRIVKWQKTREVKTKKKYNGESSPYWQFMDTKRGSDHKSGDFQNEAFEFPTSNPDILAEQEDVEENKGPSPREVIMTGWREIKFSKREQQVLKEIAAGTTQIGIAARLGISRSRVAQIIVRARAKAEKWYRKKAEKFKDS